MTLVAGVFFAALLILGCQTVPKEISEDLDARQLIQLGQDNYDLHRYKAAQKYFNTVLERYGDDPKHFIEAKYELGHLYLKIKNYRAAWDNFSEIQEIYENVPMGLPGSYKILCGIEMAKIPQDKIKEFEEKAQSEKIDNARKEQEAARIRTRAEKQMVEQEAAAAEAQPEPEKNEPEKETQNQEPAPAEPQTAPEPAKETSSEESAPAEE